MQKSEHGVLIVYTNMILQFNLLLLFFWVLLNDNKLSAECYPQVYLFYSSNTDSAR